MYELAEKHNAVVFDLYEVMGGAGSIDDWYRDELAKKDRIHFTREGYFLFADLFYNAFMNAYGDWIAANHSLSDHMQTLPRRK
jgi:lysophospholipase L1-like esterase